MIGCAWVGAVVSRRVKLHTILEDALERRRLMVEVIVATQAREGIETTRAQAARAYDRVQREKKNRRPIR